MDFQEFGIDSRLASAIRDCGISQYFFEKLLSRSLKDGENVCARIALEAGREEVLLLPALQWILASSGQERRRVLVLSPDREGAERIAAACRRIGGAAGIDASIADSESVEGDAGAALVVGTIESLVSAGERDLVRLRDFGFLVVDGADILAERPPEPMRKLAGNLLPSWERRSILACSRITVKAKNLAWDLADNPLEISIEGEVAKAQSVSKETWRVAAESKLRFLLGVIEREKPARACVFCNLRDTAEELAGRLAANGMATDYLLGALAADRKLAMLGKIESVPGAILVATDKGVEGLPAGRFPLVVNYDFPLEPELFVSRLEMLDRAAPGAKVLSLACDRYIYGLPAVEQYIDEKLEASQADESMLASEDKSAGLAFDRGAQGRDARAPDGRGRRPEQAARVPDQRGAGPRGRDDRRQGRYGNRRDPYPREDRGPDIRRSIAEATGGSLDVGGEASLGRPAEAQPGSSRGNGQGKPRAAASSKGGGRRDGGRRRDGGGAHGEGRQGRGGQQGGPRGEPRQARGDRAGRDNGRPGNPYDLPMEERMKRYREKYGQRAAAPSNRAAMPSSLDARNGSGGGPSRGAVDRGAPIDPRSLESDTQGRKGDGIFGRLFGGARKREE